MGYFAFEMDGLLASKEYKKFRKISGLGRLESIGALSIVWANSLMGIPLEKKYESVLAAMIKSGLSTETQIDPFGFMEHHQ